MRVQSWNQFRAHKKSSPSIFGVWIVARVRGAVATDLDREGGEGILVGGALA